MFLLLLSCKKGTQIQPLCCWRCRWPVRSRSWLAAAAWRLLGTCSDPAVLGAWSGGGLERELELGGVRWKHGS